MGQTLARSELEKLLYCPAGVSFKRNLIFIIVALHVRAEAYEQGKVSVAEIGLVIYESLSMVPHPETAVDTQVELRVLIYSTGIAGLKAGEGHRKRLFIELGGLRLPLILNAVHARRKHIVDGGAPRILFYVHNRHVSSSPSAGESLRLLRLNL